jgi:hypothetical protein
MCKLTPSDVNGEFDALHVHILKYIIFYFIFLLFFVLFYDSIFLIDNLFYFYAIFFF